MNYSEKKNIQKYFQLLKVEATYNTNILKYFSTSKICFMTTSIQIHQSTTMKQLYGLIIASLKSCKHVS